MKTVFAGYPAHVTQASDLPPLLLGELKAYALGLSGALIASQSQKNLINLMVEGHADFDAQGRAFEQKVSQERADGCKQLLLTEVTNDLQAALVDPANMKRLAIAAIGWGTMRPVFPHPANETDRAANRRVEVTFATAAPAPQLDDSVQRALAVLQGDGGRMRRLRCMLTKIRDMPDLSDGYPDFHAGHWGLPGSGGFPNLSPDQWSTAVSSFIVHVKPQVTSVMSGGTSAEQRAGLLNIDDNIGRNINDWMSQLNAGAATGNFDQLVLAFIQNQMANSRSVLSCYAGYSRTNPDL